jgi:hypothetical protein
LAFAVALALALAIVLALARGSGQLLRALEWFLGFLVQRWVPRRKLGEFGFLLDIVHRVMLVSFAMGIRMVFGIFNLALIFRMQFY